jgi:hypothetical protein
MIIKQVKKYFILDNPKKIAEMREERLKELKKESNRVKKSKTLFGRINLFLGDNFGKVMFIGIVLLLSFM